MRPDVSIIILVSEVSEHFTRCIDSINNYTKTSYEIIISYIGPKVQNLKKLANVKYLSCHRMNIATAYNTAIKHAKGINIILLSPQVRVKPNWTSQIIEHSNLTPSIGLVGSLESNHKYYNSASSKLRIVGNLDKSFLLIKKAVIDDIGLFDAQFNNIDFIFNDFFLRARLSGFELAHCKRCHTIKSYNINTASNIDYLHEHTDNRGKFLDKWNRVLPIKVDLIAEILNKIPPISTSTVLFLGDNQIIPNTLLKRGCKVKSYSRSKGYQALQNKDHKYDIIILYDNLTHEQTLANILDIACSILRPYGLILANIQNTLYIERVHQIFRGNFSMVSFDPALKYPISCLSLPEIMLISGITPLELMYLAGFSCKPSIEFQQLFKEICNIDPGSSLKEELCIEEYLAVWQNTSQINS